MLDELVKIFKAHQREGNLHHAYLVTGFGFGSGLLSELNFLGKDIWYETNESFGINEARRLRDFQGREPGKNYRWFIIEAATITIEAQNALLKTLEEPVIGNHFLLSLPSLLPVLPTLRSRCFIVSKSERNASQDLAKKFIKSDPETRLALVSDLDKAAAQDFLNSLEVVIYGLTDLEMITKATVLKQIIQSRDYLRDRAALPRLILEHLALCVKI